MEQTQYYKPTEIAEIFGLEPGKVRDMCHAKEQKFAFKLKPKGRFYIDIDKFREYLKTHKEADQRLYSISQISKLFRLAPNTVSEMCYARGQKFAFRLVSKGKFYIDINKFREYLRRRQDLTRENRGR